MLPNGEVEGGDDQLVSLYSERDGEWVLDCDGVVEKNKLDEFRATNVGLLKQVEELKKRYDGIDPDEVRKLAEQKQRIEEERQLKAGDIDKVVENRSPMSLQEWVDVQVGEAPHLFESNAGSGAAGGGAGGVAGRKNPWRAGADWNVTEQMRLRKKWR